MSLISFFPFPLQVMSLTQLSKTEKQKYPSSFELDPHSGVTRLNKWGGVFFFNYFKLSITLEKDFFSPLPRCIFRLYALLPMSVP